MNNVSKLIVISVIGLAAWWGYDSFTNGKIKIPQLKVPDTNEITNIETLPQPEDKNDNNEDKKQDENQDSYLYVYMLTADKSGGQFLQPVKRPLAPGKDKLTQAVSSLLAGPNNIEYSKGIYTEVPGAARLISVTTADDRVTINITNSFGTGGGSDSIYSRMRQLIKTVLANTDKPVYLQLEGKQADIIGGEGITVTQPLSEKSLDE